MTTYQERLREELQVARERRGRADPGLLEHLVGQLNRLLQIDRTAMSHLVRSRVMRSEALRDIQGLAVAWMAGHPYIGMVSVLNLLVGDDTNRIGYRETAAGMVLEFVIDGGSGAVVPEEAPSDG